MMYAAFLTVALVLFAILAWRDLRLALTILLGLLPTYLLRFSVGPIPATLLEGLILVCIAVWITKRKEWTFGLRALFPWNRPLLLLLAAACFSAAMSPDLLSALGIWKAYFIEPALVFLMLRTTFRDEKDWMRGLGALLICASGVAAFALFQKMTGIGIPAPWDVEGRTTGLFGYPNAAGLFLAPLITTAIIVLVHRATILSTFLIRASSVLILLGLPALFFCQTEAAYIAIPAGLFFAFLLSGVSRKQKILAALVGCLCVAGLFFSSFLVREKLSLSDTSGVTRRVMWAETVSMLKDHPIFGAGLSGYPLIMQEYHTQGFYEIFQYPHNIILNIWSDLGFIGLLAVAWLSILILKKIYREQSYGQISPQTTLHLIAFAALTTMVIHGLVDVPYFKNDLSVMTWFFIGIMTI